MTTLASILFTIAFFLFDVGALIALIFVICKIVAKIKARKAAKKNDDTTTDTPANTEDGDSNTKETDTGKKKTGEGTPETSEEEVKPCTPCPEKGAKKTADEALDMAEKANKKSTEALEANQVTDKKVEKEKAAKAEEQRQAYMLDKAEEIELHSLRFTEAYKEFANAIHYANSTNLAGKLTEEAKKAGKNLCQSKSEQIRQKAGYSYATDLKRDGYLDIDTRQNLGKEVLPEEHSALDENELKGFCNAANANAELRKAEAEAEAANKAVESNKDEVKNFDEVANSAVEVMKSAYAELKDCKLNDEEIATKVRLSVKLLQAIVA